MLVVKIGYRFDGLKLSYRGRVKVDESKELCDLFFGIEKLNPSSVLITVAILVGCDGGNSLVLWLEKIFSMDYNERAFPSVF